MPASYQDSYEYLKKAQDNINHLSELETRNEIAANIRIIFNQIYQAARVASMCYEVSNYEGAAAVGGSYTRTREELQQFLQASKQVTFIAHTAPLEDLEKTCLQWLQRGKDFVDHVRIEEARATNIQFARIPD